MRYTITLDESLHAAFLRSCEAQDRKGAQVLRDFMRRYVASNGQAELPLDDPGRERERVSRGARE